MQQYLLLKCNKIIFGFVFLLYSSFNCYHLEFGMYFNSYIHIKKISEINNSLKFFTKTPSHQISIFFQAPDKLRLNIESILKSLFILKEIEIK